MKGVLLKLKELNDQYSEYKNNTEINKIKVKFKDYLAEIVKCENIQKNNPYKKKGTTNKKQNTDSNKKKSRRITYSEKKLIEETSNEEQNKFHKKNQAKKTLKKLSEINPIEVGASRINLETKNTVANIKVL